MKLNPLSVAQVKEKLKKLCPSASLLEFVPYVGKPDIGMWLDMRIEIKSSEFSELSDSKMVERFEQLLVQSVAGMMTKHHNFLPKAYEDATQRSVRPEESKGHAVGMESKQDGGLGGGSKESKGDAGVGPEGIHNVDAQDGGGVPKKEGGDKEGIIGEWSRTGRRWDGYRDGAD